MAMLKIVHMASIPCRLPGLIRRVEELLPQVDILRLWLNLYTELPQALQGHMQTGKLDVVLAGTERDMGSQGKLSWLDQDANDYYLTVDDDIYYPKDYVARLTADIDRYAGKAVVSYHGGRFQVLDGEAIPVNRRCKDIRKLYSYMKIGPFDRAMHMVGMGVAGCVPSRIGLTTAAIQPPLHSGDDEDVALFCQAHKIPAICLKHDFGWLRSDNAVWPKSAMHTDVDKQKLSDTKLRQCKAWHLNTYQP